MNAPFRLPAPGGIERAEEAARNRRLLHLAVLGAGGFCLLAGAGLAAVGIGALSRAPSAPPPQFTLVDVHSREVYATVPAGDAPRLFSDDTARQHLRLLVESCGAFSREMLQMLARRCQSYLAPDMQTRWREEAKASMTRFRDGVTAWPEGIRATKVPQQAAGIQSWSVRWTMVIAGPAGTERQNLLGSFHFRWQPDAQMTEEVRELNPAGMQVVGYSYGADPGR